MQLERFTEIEAFAARVEPYLLAHEATHCLMLGLLTTLPRDPAPADEAPYMALVAEDEAVALVAMRTRPEQRACRARFFSRRERQQCRHDGRQQQRS